MNLRIRCKRCTGPMFATEEEQTIYGLTITLTCVHCGSDQYLQSAATALIKRIATEHIESAALSLILRGVKFIEVDYPYRKRAPRKALEKPQTPPPSASPVLVWCDGEISHQYDPSGPLLAGNRRCPECYTLQIKKQAHKKMLKRGGGVPLAEKICDTLLRETKPITLHELAVIMGLADPVVRGCLSYLKGKGIVSTGHGPQGGVSYSLVRVENAS